MWPAARVRPWVRRASGCPPHSGAVQPGSTATAAGSSSERPRGQRRLCGEGRCDPRPQPSPPVPQRGATCSPGKRSAAWPRVWNSNGQRKGAHSAPGSQGGVDSPRRGSLSDSPKRPTRLPAMGGSRGAADPLTFPRFGCHLPCVPLLSFHSSCLPCASVRFGEEVEINTCPVCLVLMKSPLGQF